MPRRGARAGSVIPFPRLAATSAAPHVAGARPLPSTLQLPHRPAVPAWPTRSGVAPSSAIGFWGRRRFRPIRFLRLLSRPYYAYGLGDEARLSAENHAGAGAGRGGTSG